MAKREIKRFIIIVIYLLIFSVLGALIYYIFEPAPTCSDGKKNQSEERIDCGGSVCAPCEKIINAKEINIDEKHFVYGNKDQYDVMVGLTNPNDKYGAIKFDYEFQLTDQSGAVLQRRSGKNFILPDENKFIIELNLYSSVNPYAVNFEIKNIEWDEFLEYDEPRLNIYEKNYREEFENNITTGLMRNESYFDFNSIEIDIVLRNDSGKPIALGKNEMRTIKSQEERDFKLIWPYKFSENVGKVDIKAEADVFDSDNFIKKHLPSRQFQDYDY